MIIEVKNLNLKETITCGQIFRFKEEEDNSFTVVLPDRVVNLKLDNNKLIIDSNEIENLESAVRNYLDLDFDYGNINKKIISVDKSKKDVLDFCSGLKMINEPKFEVVISYIISANNRIPQIKKVLDNISKKFGKKVLFRNAEYYLFPTEDELKGATVDDYRQCKAGFRDKYIYDFVSKINNKEIDLDLIDKMDSEEALKYLMTINGIGEKVASCILLFGYHRFDVFPIDTWVKKYMKQNYNLCTVKEIRNYMKDKYKENCGLFIQYIFDYSRNKED